MRSQKGKVILVYSDEYGEDEEGQMLMAIGHENRTGM